jgi:A/G-specific adenine glycosylase
MKLNYETLMRLPASNRTIEGRLDALQWLNDNPEMPSKLCRLLVSYYLANGRDFPWRRTSDPYKILIAEVLLQKTGVKPVEKVWTAFIQRYPSIEALASASTEDIENIIRPLGIQKRAKVLLEIAQTVVQGTGGEIVGDVGFLTSLSGIGYGGTKSQDNFEPKLR